MAETIEVGCDGTKKWHWHNIRLDLLRYGALDKEKLSIDPFSVEGHCCAGAYENTLFHITWVKDTFLLLSMFGEAVPELIRALATIVEYEPFVKYEVGNRATTVEWDKINPDERLSAIHGLEDVTNICDIR